MRLMWDRLRAIFGAPLQPEARHPAELDTALRLLAPHWAARGQPSGWAYAHWSNDRRYVAVLRDDHVTCVVDLHELRWLELPQGSPRGFEGTTLSLELDTRFDPFPTMADIEDVDLRDPSLPWQPCCKDPGHP